MNVQNKVQPQENTLSEFEKVSVEQYFDTIKFILSTFHYEVFETVEESYIDNKLYYIEADGVSAKAKALENGASQRSLSAVQHFSSSYPLSSTSSKKSTLRPRFASTNHYRDFQKSGRTGRSFVLHFLPLFLRGLETFDVQFQEGGVGRS
jgi:hypothetical protein